MLTAFLSPLATTSALAEPKLTALGVALQLGLARVTVNNLPKNVGGIAQVEQSALAKLVTTSTTNRLTRVALGSVHIWASICLAARHEKSLEKTEKRGEESRGMALLRSVASLGGSLVLCLLAGVWISSGYYGQ